MTRTDRRNVLICAAVVVGSFFLVKPFVDFPFNDDWSYAFTVRQLLRTGRITFNGWGSPALIPQAYWGMLFCKLFGFSFVTLRLSMLPIAIGSVLLCYLLGRQAGLRPGLALFAALLLALSPMFLPLATSFMTDVPGLFFILLALYLLIRAAQPPIPQTKSTGKKRKPVSLAPPHRGIAWLAVGILAGLIGGMNRQIAWIVPLALLPYLICLRRRDRVFCAIAAGGWLLIVLVALYISHWLAGQPYWIPVYSTSSYFQDALADPQKIAEQFLSVLFTTILLILPAAVPFCTLALMLMWRRAGGLNRTMAVAIFAILAGLFYISFGLEPWLENIVSIRGILSPYELSGVRPISQPLVVRAILSFAVFLVSFTALARLGEWAFSPRQAAADILQIFLRPSDGQIALPAMGIAAAAYFVVLLLPAIIKLEFDRYCLPLIPVAAIVLLVAAQSRTAPRWSVRAACGLLVVFCLYGVAATQDVRALAQARFVATHRLEDAHIPATDIAAGFEHDGWTQLQKSGHINHRKMTNPPDAYDPHRGLMPDMTCHYRIEYQPRDRITSTTDFGAVDYISWLPPFQRRIYIDRYVVPWWRLRDSEYAMLPFEGFWFDFRR